jgi:mannose-6-phosphate isomerase-like protein (cupin superfamily)
MDDRVIAAGDTGMRIQFREVGADTDGERVTFDMWLDPPLESCGPINHIHPVLEEVLAVESGRLAVSLDGDTIMLDPGEEITIPPGVPHHFWNAGPDELHAVATAKPPIDTVAFLCTTFGMMRDYPTTDAGLVINQFRLAPVLDEYDDFLYFPTIPVALQKAVIRGLARIGERLGYPRRYPDYLPEEMR